MTDRATPTDTQRIRSFLTGFFGPGNDLRLETMSANAQEWLSPWLDELKTGTGRPVVLPRLRDKRVTWYAMAFSPSQFRALGEALTAFVGPSYSDFNGQPSQLNPADPIDAAVAKFCDGLAFSLTVEPPAATREARDSLALLQAIWRATPPKARTSPRPVGRILRDFGMALRARDSDASAAYIEELRLTGRLTASNLAFLKVERLEALELWDEVVTSPEMVTLLAIRRPVAVTQALLRAVFHVKLAGFDLATQRDEVLETFRSDVLPLYQPLFKSWRGFRAIEALLLFAMSALCSRPPRTGVVADMLAAVPDSDRDRLLALVGETPPIEQLLRMGPEEAVRRGDFDELFRIACTMLPSVETAGILLRCSYELGTLEAATAAQAAVAQLPDSERKSLLDQRTHRMWLQALVPPIPDDAAGPDSSLPAGWLEWLSRVNNEGPFAGAMAVAAAGANEWRVEDLASDPVEVAAVSSALLAARSAESDALVRDALPAFIQFLRQSGVWRPSLKPAYHSAIVLIATDPAIGTNDLAVLSDLAEDLLEFGVTASEYADLVDYLGETWSVAAAPRNVDWCLDMIDCLAQYPSPDGQARSALIMNWFATFMPWRRRLTGYQIRLMQSLADELGANEVVAPLVEVREGVPTSESVSDKLRGLRVGIYTLTESAGKHAADALLHLGAASVVVNHDKVGSERLKRLAQEVDVLLVAVRSAKHAATDFIGMHRSRGKQTLVCPGKGSAGMLRTLATYLESISA
jgi:hypothetical protein